jgi:hypothetical protein
MACTWFFNRVRCRTSVARKRTSTRSSRVAASAIQASGSRSQRSRCAKVAESTLSFFNLAEAMAFTRCGCTR